MNISLLIIALASSSLLGTSFDMPARPIVKTLAEPVFGTLQDAINAANDDGNGSYKKTTTVSLEESYPDTYPWNEHNPLTTNYTKDGLYMVGRGSGYYTYNGAIWHYSNVEGVETRSLSMSEYSTFHSYYRTLRDFGGVYVTSHLQVKADTGGLIYENKADAYASDADMISLIYFIAPLVKTNSAVISDFSCEFSIKASGDSYVLDAISIATKLTIDSTIYNLSSSASFSDIGSTELGYSLE